MLLSSILDRDKRSSARAVSVAWRVAVGVARVVTHTIPSARTASGDIMLRLPLSLHPPGLFLLLIAVMFRSVAAIEVLMVGNSYTSPVAPMVRSLMEEIYTNSSVLPITAGGAQLQGWPTDANLKNALSGDQQYDWVVLQDQSQVAGFHVFSDFQQSRVEPVVAIDSLIRENGARTLLYATWGRERGDTMNSFYPDFKTMNQLLLEGYTLYRDAISTPERPALIAPVGLAFEAVYDAVVEEGVVDPAAVESQFSKLYQGDGSHASNLGSYLAACVLVSTITGTDPREWIYSPSLSEEDRDMMQEFAWKAVQDFVGEQHTQQSTMPPTVQPTTAAPSLPSTEAPTGSPTQYQPADMTQSTKAESSASGGGRKASFHAGVCLLSMLLLII